MKQNNSKKGMRLKIKAMSLIGKLECTICGEKHIEYLSIDHSDGNGAEHRKQIFGEIENYRLHKRYALSGAGQHFYYWLIKQSTDEIQKMNLRILCMNCNTSTHNYGYSYNKYGDRVYKNPALLDGDLLFGRWV